MDRFWRNKGCSMKHEITMSINTDEVREEAVAALREALKHAPDPLTKHAIARTLLDYCSEYEPTPLAKLRQSLPAEQRPGTVN